MAEPVSTSTAFLSAASGLLSGGGGPLPPTISDAEGSRNNITIGGFNVPDYNTGTQKAIEAVVKGAVVLAIAWVLIKK